MTDQPEQSARIYARRAIFEIAKMEDELAALRERISQLETDNDTKAAEIVAGLIYPLRNDWPDRAELRDMVRAAHDANVKMIAKVLQLDRP